MSLPTASNHCDWFIVIQMKCVLPKDTAAAEVK